MGIFGKVILGGLAFLAGAAFMADENEKQHKHGQRSWSRLPNDSNLNTDKASIAQNVKEWMNKNANIEDEATKQALYHDFAKIAEDMQRKKEAANQPQPTPTFSDPPAGTPPTFMDPPVIQQQPTQAPFIQPQPLLKFPIYGSTIQKGPWSQESNVDSARQIGVLEVYRDSLSKLIDMPEFKDLKLDKQAIKKFLDNEFVQSFLKARLANAGISTDWFRSATSAQPSSQPTTASTPAPTPTSPEGQQHQAAPSMAAEPSATVDSIEHRVSSSISVGNGKIGFIDGIDPISKPE